VSSSSQFYRLITLSVGQQFAGPIGLDGLYWKGVLIEQGANNPFIAANPRIRAINALKGTWVDDHHLCRRLASTRERECSR
jgi:hypothetical protein